MNDKLRKLVLLDNLNGTLKNGKTDLMEASLMVSSIDFNLAFIKIIENKIEFKDYFMCLALSEILTTDLEEQESPYVHYYVCKNKSDVEKAIEIYKKNIIESKKNIALQIEDIKKELSKIKDKDTKEIYIKSLEELQNGFSFENQRIYDELDIEEKNLIDYYLDLFYPNKIDGFHDEFYLFQYMFYFHNYIKKFGVLFKELVPKIKDINMFSLGLYSKDDYNLMCNYRDKLANELNLDMFFLSINIEDISFHDERMDINLIHDEIIFKFQNSSSIKFCNVKIIENQISDFLNLEGYVYYLFKTNDQKYLGIFDFGNQQIISFIFDSYKINDN